jgi:hypothetical protein
MNILSTYCHHTMMQKTRCKVNLSTQTVVWMELLDKIINVILIFLLTQAPEVQ